MELNKDTLLEVAKNGVYHATGNASLTCQQLAFTVAEYINDEFKAGAVGSYDSSRSTYTVTIPSTDDRPGHLITWNFVRRDDSTHVGEYFPVLKHNHIDNKGNKDVAKEYDTIAQAMHKDSDYLWSWFCNVAVTLGDHSNLTGYECAVAAAGLLQHLWKVDVTKHPFYIEQLERTRPSSHAITHDEAFSNPDTNHVYVNVTGFGPNSGATAFAKRINQALQGQGFASFLNVADTTLSQDEVSGEVQGNTVFSITAVESRTNTDRYRDPDEAEVEEAIEEGDPDPGNDLDSEEGSDADEFDDDDAGVFGEGADPDKGFTFAESYSPPHELELVLQDHDIHPVLTIRYFQDNLPGTTVKAKYKVDHHLTDAIHQMYLEPAGKTLHVTLDPKDPDPSATVDAIQSVVLEHAAKENPMLKVTDYKPTLDDPEYLKNAYVLQMDGVEEFCVLHVDTESPDFDVSVFHLNGIDAVPTDDMGAFIKGLEEHAPSALDHLETLVNNNRRWAKTFQSLKAWNDAVKRTPTTPFTLYNIAQEAIPKSIYGLVESCWTDWQQTVKLEELSREIGDPSVIIPFDSYVTKTQGGFMVVREHPRLEELFLKLLKARARNNKTLASWLTCMGH